MTSLTNAGNNLGASEFIHYNTYDTAPIKACSVVSSGRGLNFVKGWLQADTAEQCHKNAFKLYNQYRKWEDDLIQSGNMDRKNGLRIRTVQSISSNVNVFNGRRGSEQGNSKNISPGQSVEFFGFFVPNTTGFYKFSFATGNGGRIWAGDVACHEYMETNQTRELIHMYANKYYAVRFQHSNSSRDQQTVQIQATMQGGAPFEQKFVSVIHKNGNYFNRNLLYYGLVKSEYPGKYYCYFNGRSNYGEIRRTKGLDTLERWFAVQSDANPPPKNDQRIAHEWGSNLNLAVKSNPTHNITITNAVYRVPEGKERRYNITIPETDPNKLNEWYRHEIFKYEQRSRRYWWWGWRTRRWWVRVEPTFEWRQRPRYPVPTKLKEMKEAPNPLNVTEKAKGMGDININAGTYNARWGRDPNPGQVKQSIVDYTSSLKPELKKNKNIRVSDKCEVLVNYNNIQDVTANGILYTAQGDCKDKRIVINSTGTVTVNGSEWINILSSVPAEDRNNLVENKLWTSQRFPDSLNIGANLSTIVSKDGRFKLVFDRGNLRCYYNVKATYDDNMGNKYSIMDPKISSPQALFLYRPNYSELGGKKYTTMPNPNGSGNTMLVEITPAHPAVLNSEFTQEKGYPILFNQYRQQTGDCKQLCEKSKKCGNYISYGSGKCGLDQTTNLNPMFTTTPPTAGELATENLPTIYIKNPVMIDQSFTLKNAGNYSDYEISKDTYRLSAPLTTEPNRVSGAINKRYNLFDFIIKNIEPKTEGFSDIPPRFSNRLPNAPETSVEEGRIEDLQTIMFQQNALYSVSSIAALSFLVGAFALARD